MDAEMMKALEADAKKLRDLTGDVQHQIAFMDEPCDVCGCWPCAHTDPYTWEWRGDWPSLIGESHNAR